MNLDSKNRGQPFSKLRIVDFSWAVVGPLITKYFADFGAEVIKIESALHPDTLRLSAPFADHRPGLNRSGYFALINGNKYSMALDLTKSRSLEIARRLADRADIVVESFRPGVISKLGLGYAQLKNTNPSLIMLSTSTQGQTGPYAGQPGFGFQVTGLVGLPYVTGWPDRSPLPVPVAYTDYVVPYFGAAALIAALDRRDRTGQGLFLDLSQTEAGLQFLSAMMLDVTVNARQPQRSGNSAADAAPHGVYRCRGDDKWCTIAVSEDRQWLALVAGMDHPAWASETRFRTLEDRKNYETELDRLIEAFTVNFSPEEIMQKLQSAGIPCGIVASGEMLVNDPHLQARGYYKELSHQEMGSALTAGQPFQMSQTPARIDRAAPCLGEHTEFVCKEILGISDREFLELLDAGCLE